jgi:hypothetical protein
MKEWNENGNWRRKITNEKRKSVIFHNSTGLNLAEGTPQHYAVGLCTLQRTCVKGLLFEIQATRRSMFGVTYLYRQWKG